MNTHEKQIQRRKHHEKEQTVPVRAFADAGRRHADRLRQLCFLYAVVFGAFVAFSNYLPTYLSNIYHFDANDAGMRAAGFAAAAVVARPFGGVLADKFGPKIISLISLGGVVILAVITAPPREMRET